MQKSCNKKQSLWENGVRTTVDNVTRDTFKKDRNLTKMVAVLYILNGQEIHKQYKKQPWPLQPQLMLYRSPSSHRAQVARVQLLWGGGWFQWMATPRLGMGAGQKGRWGKKYTDQPLAAHSSNCTIRHRALHLEKDQEFACGTGCWNGGCL